LYTINVKLNLLKSLSVILFSLFIIFEKLVFMICIENCAKNFLVSIFTLQIFLFRRFENLMFLIIMLFYYYQYVIVYHIYRVSVKKGQSRGWEHGRVKENKKVLYHFANFAITNELLISKNCRISSAYWLMQARDKMRSPC